MPKAPAELTTLEHSPDASSAEYPYLVRQAARWDHSSEESPAHFALEVPWTKKPLPPDQAQIIIDGLAQDVKLVYRCGLTPKNLPGLVENNHQIAVEVLMKSMLGSQMQDYLEALVNMESLHSLEVVKRLMKFDLPPKFIHAYISKCVSSCENIKDKNMQNRLVQLVSAFLTSMSDNNIIEAEEMFMAFAKKFRDIDEAE